MNDRSLEERRDYSLKIPTNHKFMSLFQFRSALTISVSNQPFITSLLQQWIFKSSKHFLWGINVSWQFTEIQYKNCMDYSNVAKHNVMQNISFSTFLMG